MTIDGRSRMVLSKGLQGTVLFRLLGHLLPGNDRHIQL